MLMPKAFIMTLQECDLNAAKKEGPETCLLKPARDRLPEFWGWPDKYVRPENPTRNTMNQRSRNIRLQFRGHIYDARMWGYATKTEFRLRSEEIRSAARAPNDLLILSREPTSGADFEAEIIYPEDPQHGTLIKDCIHKAESGNSLKHYNYFDENFKPCSVRHQLWIVVHDRQEEILYTPFPTKAKADDLAKSIRKSNGCARVVPYLEQIED